VEHDRLESEARAVSVLACAWDFIRSPKSPNDIKTMILFPSRRAAHSD
jgi:hypothetical protein